MLEVLFTESAGGAMQYAKSMKYTIGSASAVAVLTDDGTEPTEEEIRRVEAECRKKRENETPMEGKPQDVACFPLGLSMGDILDPISGQRASYLQSMVLISDAEFTDVGKAMVQTARQGLEKVLEAIRKGEPVRLWYSQNPDELCGFCHLLSLLPMDADIRAVKLPEYEVGERSVVTYTGWGEVDPGHFAGFLPRERKLTRPERMYFSARWRELQRENSPLRAVVNGRLRSVGMDFYDPFIRKELDGAETEFHEARLIGNVLGKYQLGIGDWLVAIRIEEFISQGMIVPVTEPAEGCPIYHRYLRKI